jgi:hypothetical protein
MSGMCIRNRKAEADIAFSSAIKTLIGPDTRVLGRNDDSMIGANASER